MALQSVTKAINTYQSEVKYGQIILIANVCKDVKDYLHNYAPSSHHSIRILIQQKNVNGNHIKILKKKIYKRHKECNYQMTQPVYCKGKCEN